MIYRIRSTKPTVSEWVEIEHDGSAFEAANQVHCDHDGERLPSIATERASDNGGREVVKFALMEIEGHGETVSRLFESGIRRKGVRQPLPTLREIATKLGWERDPTELLADWDHEETYDAAKERRDRRWGVRK